MVRLSSVLAYFFVTFNAFAGTTGNEPLVGATISVGEIYNIDENAPNVDIATATLGRVLTKDYIENVPLGRERDFSSAMSASPSAEAENDGYGLGGATVNENV